MMAIHTKFIGPTNTRGARIKAYTSGSTYIKGLDVTIPFPNNDDRVTAHFKAVLALVDKHGLHVDTDNMRYGDSADNRGFSFCFDSSKVPA
jgi:hypothetical protein